MLIGFIDILRWVR